MPRKGYKNITVPEEFHAHIKRVAEAEGLSVPDLLRKTLGSQNSEHPGPVGAGKKEEKRRDYIWTYNYCTICSDCETHDGLHVIEVNVDKATAFLQCAGCGKKTMLDVTITKNDDEPIKIEVHARDEEGLGMTVIPPIIALDNIGTILCPGCRAIMRPLHWHYPDKDPLFTNMFLCTDCGEYVFDKETQECMTFPRNMKEASI